MRTKVKGFTLLELIIALILFSIIVLAFTNFELFGRYQLISSDRRAKLQNEVSRLIDHVSKHIIEAAQGQGSALMGPGNVVSITTPANRVQLSYYADVPASGATLADGVGDTWRSYRFYNSGAAAANRNQVQYCSQCNNSNCGTCTGGWAIIAQRIATFTPTPNPLTSNSVNINTAACWDAVTTPFPGNQDNPCVSMQATITLPSVAIN